MPKSYLLTYFPEQHWTFTPSICAFSVNHLKHLVACRIRIYISPRIKPYLRIRKFWANMTFEVGIWKSKYLWLLLSDGESIVRPHRLSRQTWERLKVETECVLTFRAHACILGVSSGHIHHTRRINTAGDTIQYTLYALIGGDRASQTNEYRMRTEYQGTPTIPDGSILLSRHCTVYP